MATKLNLSTDDFAFNAATGCYEALYDDQLLSVQLEEWDQEAADAGEGTPLVWGQIAEEGSNDRVSLSPVNPDAYTLPPGHERVEVQVPLTRDEAEYLQRVGGGNLSVGVEKALRQLWAQEEAPK